MDYEVKFAYSSGKNLVFTAYQQDGSGRGVAEQNLPELYPHGYYRAEPATALVDSDVVIVYIQREVYYDDELVFYLDYEKVLYEGQYVYYEGEYVIDYDTKSNQKVLWTGRPVGFGEYTFGSGDVSDLIEDVEELQISSMTNNESYDETQKAAEYAVIKNL